MTDTNFQNENQNTGEQQEWDLEKLLSENTPVEIYFPVYSVMIDLIQAKNPNRCVRKSLRSITLLP